MGTSGLSTLKKDHRAVQRPIRGRAMRLFVIGLIGVWTGAAVAAQAPARPTPPDGAAAVSATPSPESVLPSMTPVSDYVVGPQDVLTISVFGHSDLNGQFRVDGDGTFTFPYIGRVKAGELTVRQLEGEITRLLKEFFKEPQVSVAIGQYKSRRLFIVGEVRSPGSYVLTGNMSLIEAIALAGSALPTASGDVLIVRGGINGANAAVPVLPTGEKPGVDRVDLDALQRGHLDQNVALHDGDTIFIPRAENVFLVGQVKSPGAYPVRRGTTVLQALALAGGVTDRGASNRVQIERLEKGTKVKIRAELDDAVQGGDTIIVPAKFF
jgi:polysaccharide biosynthesis/export protein